MNDQPQIRPLKLVDPSEPPSDAPTNRSGSLKADSAGSRPDPSERNQPHRAAPVAQAAGTANPTPAPISATGLPASGSGVGASAPGRSPRPSATAWSVGHGSPNYPAPTTGVVATNYQTATAGAAGARNVSQPRPKAPGAAPKKAQAVPPGAATGAPIGAITPVKVPVHLANVNGAGSTARAGSGAGRSASPHLPPPLLLPGSAGSNGPSPGPMPVQQGPDPAAPGLDSGLACVLLLARFHQKPASPEGLRHAHGAGNPFGPEEVIAALKGLHFKSKLSHIRKDRLDKVTLPAILPPPAVPSPAAESAEESPEAEGGSPHASPDTGEIPAPHPGFRILARVEEGRALIHDPSQQRPRTVELAELEAEWDGRLILAAPREGGRSDGKRFDVTWFIPAVIRYRRHFGQVLAAALFLQIFALVSPLFFQVIIDKVLVHRGLTTLDVLALGMLGVAIFEVLLGGLRTYLLSHTTNRIDVELGARLYHHLMRLPMAYFGSRRVGDSVARVRELETIRNFITGSALSVAIDLPFTVIFLGVMFYYSPLLTAIVAGSIPCYILLSLIVSPMLRRRVEEKFKRGAENQAFLVESVTGVQTVKALALEPQMGRRWEERLASYVGTAFRATQVGNVASQTAGFINKLTTLLILWFGAHLVMTGDLSVGQLVAINILSGRVSGPVLRLVHLWQEYQQAGVSLQRLGDILNAPTEGHADPSRGALPNLKGKVSLERVSFRYHPERPEVLRDFSLEVNPGETVGVVGPSGSGKSTLTRLVQRLYAPERGRVLMDGVDLAQVDPAWLRRQVGVVLQESFLFNRSVRENIAIADPGLSMERVIAAAQLAGAHEFILELPQGYDTVLDEQGGNLSGGQRQRVAIARALVNNPRVLIFDEATSALDYESEKIIQQNMAAICQGRTVIIIAHRLSAVRQCTRLVVVDKGALVEAGTYAELVGRGGWFAQMHQHQSGGDLKTA